MTACDKMARGPHFWWCHVYLRPHTPRCTCPPDRLAAAVEKEDRERAEAIQVRIVTPAEAK